MLMLTSRGVSDLVSGMPSPTFQTWRLLRAPALVVGFAVAFAATAGAQTDERLADAAMKRDRAAVRALVEQKVDVNAPGRDGTPALHWVVRVDDLDTTKLLIRAGADAKRADRYGVLPLFIACSNGNAE